MPESLQYTPHLAYYAIYHDVCALFTARQTPVKDTHASARKTYASEVRQKKLFSSIWAVYCDGGPKTNEMSVQKMPSHAKPIGGYHNLRNPSRGSAWDSLQSCLKSTRYRAIDDRLREERNRLDTPRLPAGRSKKIAEATPETTILDFFWRMRTRSDYQDVDAFISGIVSSMEAGEFHRHLLSIVGATLTALETVIVANTGRAIYEQEATRFLSKISNDLVPGLKPRMEAILA